MDSTTGSDEAVGDHGASSRRVVNGDDAADRYAARRGTTDGGGRLASRAKRGKPCVRRARRGSAEAMPGLPWASREGCRTGCTRRAASGHRAMADWPREGIGRGRRRREYAGRGRRSPRGRAAQHDGEKRPRGRVCRNLRFQVQGRARARWSVDRLPHHAATHRRRGWPGVQGQGWLDRRNSPGQP
jgi:hypothetical protein